jgi:hypothetical protein
MKSPRGDPSYPANGGRLLQHGAARCHLDRGDASAVKHDEPIAVFAAQHARILGKRRDDLFNELFLVGDRGFVVRDVHAVAAE